MVLVVVVPSTHPIESCGVPSKTKTYQALQIGEAVTFRKMGEASQPPQTSLVKTKNKGGMLVGVHQIWGGSLREIHFLFLTRSFVLNSTILLSLL